jgi:anti-sigma factor RsiW
MMCRSVRRRLSDYLDASLPARTLLEIEVHLEHCAGCRREEQALRRVLALTRRFASRTVPVDVTGAVLSQLGTVPAERVRWPMHAAILSATAIAALSLWAVTSTLTDRPQPPVAVAARTLHDQSRDAQALGSDGLILAADIPDLGREGWRR